MTNWAQVLRGLDAPASDPVGAAAAALGQVESGAAIPGSIARFAPGWKPNTAYPGGSVVGVGCALYSSAVPVPASSYFDPTVWDLTIPDVGGITPFRELAGSDSAVRVLEVAASLYQLLVSIGGGRWAVWELRRTDAFVAAIAGSTTVHILGNSGIYVPVLSKPFSDASVTLSAGWGGSTAQALAYNGAYNAVFSGTGLTRSATWTSPANVTAVGMRHLRFSNSGVWKVTVDGGPANLLPTAAQLVANGVLPNTILVANGGLLAPTDTIFSAYGPNQDYDAHTLLADELAAGVHTVVAYYTGYKESASTAANIGLSGFTYQTATTNIDTASTAMLPESFSQGFTAGGNGAAPGADAYEYAHSIQPTGTATPTFVGNAHGSETEQSLSFAVDGAPATPTIGAYLIGTDRITITRQTTLFHPQLGGGATPVANVTTIYRLNGHGLRVATKISWLVGGLGQTCYSAMFPLNGEFDKVMVDRGAPINLGAHFPPAGTTYYGQLKGKMITAWKSGGGPSPSQARFAAGMLVPDPHGTLNRWQHAGTASANTSASRMCAKVASGSSKLYATRAATSDPAGGEKIIAGDTWTGDMLFMQARFSGRMYAAANFTKATGVADQSLSSVATGPVTAPAVPASTVALVNPFPFPIDVYVSGGTVTVITVAGVVTGQTSGYVRLARDAAIAITYSVVPTWQWIAA